MHIKIGPARLFIYRNIIEAHIFYKGKYKVCTEHTKLYFVFQIKRWDLNGKVRAYLINDSAKASGAR